MGGGTDPNSNRKTPITVRPTEPSSRMDKTLGQISGRFPGSIGTGKDGHQLFHQLQPPSSPAPPPIVVQQGKIEASNVAPAESAVRLVDVMRQFEMLQKAIAMTTEMNKKALDEVARVGAAKALARRKEQKMIRALYSAASGMTAQQMNVDNIANNLANSNTAGYKARRAQFQDLLYQNMIQPGAAAGQQIDGAHRPATRPGHPRGVERNHLHAGRFFADRQSAGSGHPGQRLFPDSAAQRRPRLHARGQFQLNQTGNVVDANGNLLQPQITFPQNAQSITIATDGTVSYTLPGQTASQTAGQIQLATFANPAGLNSLGQNLYQPTTASGEPIVGNPGGQEGLGTLLQGYTEQSNVSVVDEFVNLIVSQRAYEANSKVVKAADEMYQEMNNLTQMIALLPFLPGLRLAGRPDARRSIARRSRARCRGPGSGVRAVARRIFFSATCRLSGAPQNFSRRRTERIAKNRGVDLARTPRRVFRAATVRSRCGDRFATRCAKSSRHPRTRRSRFFVEPASVRPAKSSFRATGFSGSLGLEDHPGTAMSLRRRRRRPDFLSGPRRGSRASMTRVVAAADLPAGKADSSEPGSSGNLRGFAVRRHDGAQPRRSGRVPPENPLRATAADPQDAGGAPRTSRAATLVRVDVFAGAAHLSSKPARKPAGIKGSTIPVRNLSSGKDFRAEVTGKDQVTVGRIRFGMKQ